MKQCPNCQEHKPLDDFPNDRTKPDGKQSWCRDCHHANHKHTNPIENAKNMYVDGKYISRKHPLHKPGRYNSFGSAWSDVEIKNRVKTGYVYIVSCEIHEKEQWYKVGCAVDSYDRVKQYQTASPHRDYRVIYHCYFDDRESAEEKVHTLLKSNPNVVEWSYEWFKADPMTIIKVIEDVKQKETDTRHRDEHSAQYNLGLCD